MLGWALLPLAALAGGCGVDDDGSATATDVATSAPATTAVATSALEAPVRVAFSPNPVARGSEVTVTPLDGARYNRWELVLYGTDGELVGMLASGGWQAGANATVGGYYLAPTSDTLTMLVPQEAPTGHFLACFHLATAREDGAVCGPLTIT